MGQPRAVSDLRRFRPLTEWTSVHDLADRCRAGVLAFVAGTATGWSRVQLASWLVDHYRPATRAFPRPVSSRESLPLAELGSAFEILMVDAASTIRDDVARCASPREIPGFAVEAVEQGHVVGVHDSAGALGYVAVERASMTLVERVCSLLAADFLTRPNDYRTVEICEECGAVSFEWMPCAHAHGTERAESGVVLAQPASHAAMWPIAEEAWSS